MQPGAEQNTLVQHRIQRRMPLEQKSLCQDQSSALRILSWVPIPSCTPGCVLGSRSWQFMCSWYFLILFHSNRYTCRSFQMPQTPLLVSEFHGAAALLTSCIDKLSGQLCSDAPVRIHLVCACWAGSMPWMPFVFDFMMTTVSSNGRERSMR
jgi:hypothetical protein